MTFDAVNIYAPTCWEPGQIYVALSRSRDISHMYLEGGLKPQHLIVDDKVIEFYKAYEEAV